MARFKYLRTRLNRFVVSAVLVFMDLKVSAVCLYPRAWTAPVVAWIARPSCDRGVSLDVSHLIAYFLLMYGPSADVANTAADGYHFMRLRDILVGNGVTFADGDMLTIVVGDYRRRISLSRRDHRGGIIQM